MKVFIARKDFARNAKPILGKDGLERSYGRAFDTDHHVAPTAVLDLLVIAAFALWYAGKVKVRDIGDLLLYFALGVMVSFAVLSVVAIGFVFKFLPETKGRSVEQVVQIFEKEAERSKAPV